MSGSGHQRGTESPRKQYSTEESYQRAVDRRHRQTPSYNPPSYQHNRSHSVGDIPSRATSSFHMYTERINDNESSLRYNHLRDRSANAFHFLQSPQQDTSGFNFDGSAGRSDEAAHQRAPLLFADRHSRKGGISKHSRRHRSSHTISQRATNRSPAPEASARYLNGDGSDPKVAGMSTHTMNERAPNREANPFPFNADKDSILPLGAIRPKPMGSPGPLVWNSANSRQTATPENHANYSGSTAHSYSQLELPQASAHYEPTRIGLGIDVPSSIEDPPKSSFERPTAASSQRSSSLRHDASLQANSQQTQLPLAPTMMSPDSALSSWIFPSPSNAHHPSHPQFDSSNFQHNISHPRHSQMSGGRALAEHVPGTTPLTSYHESAGNEFDLRWPLEASQHQSLYEQENYAPFSNLHRNDQPEYQRRADYSTYDGAPDPQSWHAMRPENVKSDTRTFRQSLWEPSADKNWNTAQTQFEARYTANAETDEDHLYRRRFKPSEDAVRYNSSYVLPTAGPLMSSSDEYYMALNDQSMNVPGNDYAEESKNMQWSEKSEEELIKLLDPAERFKWKYVSEMLSKNQHKRIPSRACRKKFEALFGETEYSSSLKSSLFYVAYQSGWQCIRSLTTKSERDAMANPDESPALFDEAAIKASEDKEDPFGSKSTDR